MKQTLFLFLICGVVLLNSCSKSIQHSNIEQLISFDKNITKEKLPLKATLIISEDFKAKMPLFDEGDREIWTWFLISGLKPIFKDAVLVDDLTGRKISEDALIIKPELWTFFWSRKHCALGFKFRFIDKYGNQQLSIIAEGRSTTATIDVPFIGEINYDRVVAQAMDDMMIKFQSIIIERKKEILSMVK